MMATEPLFSAVVPRGLYSSAQIKQYEGAAAAATGRTLYDLMELAGAAVAAAAVARFPAAARIAVACGTGGNGGDGYVAARLLRARGLAVAVYAADPAAPLRGDAARAQAAYLAAGGAPAQPFAPAFAAGADLVLDALLGIGLASPVRPALAAAIAALNAPGGPPVLAVDVPSGLCADTGRVWGAAAVRATATLSLLAPKMGLATGAAADHIGELLHASLGADVAAAFVRAAPPPPAVRVGYRDYAARWLAPRARAAHKGHCGRVVVVGGGPGMPGAARLAGEAAQRAGAGLVRVVADPSSAPAIAAGRPELMVSALALATGNNNNNNNNNSGSGSGRSGVIAELDAALAWASVVAVGPGLGLAEHTFGPAAFAHAVPWLAARRVPAVLDADALSLLAAFCARGDAEPLRSDAWVLTPHPGEAARLLGTTTALVEADRFAAVRALQRRYGGVVVLKGAGTLVYGGEDAAAAGDAVRVVRAGNPGMASGGMGDALTGIVAALLAQGVPAHVAAPLGVALHGDAATLAARGPGERGLLASDLFEPLRALVNPGPRPPPRLSDDDLPPVE